MSLNRLPHYSILGDTTRKVFQNDVGEAKMAIVMAGGIDKSDLVSCIWVACWLCSHFIYCTLSLQVDVRTYVDDGHVQTSVPVAKSTKKINQQLVCKAVSKKRLWGYRICKTTRKLELLEAQLKKRIEYIEVKVFLWHHPGWLVKAQVRDSVSVG